MDDHFFMEQALDLARRALEAGEFPVGCIFVYEKRVVASGARSGTRSKKPNESDHAEMIALRRLNALEEDFVFEDLVVYSTMEPCLMCFAALTLSRIGRIVYGYEDVMGGGTGCDFNSLPPLYKTLKPSITGGVLRASSLKLFQEFFASPTTDYWQGSLLANYTIEQPVI